MTYLSSTTKAENIDKMGRSINYLRISVTDRCNLACRYCVPKDALPLLSHNKIARYEEILKITEIAAGIGITKVRITGGEPFVRKGIYKFIKNIYLINGIRDIAVTTNGVLLKKQIKQIETCGIKRLNISLDTLIPDKFKYITGKDYFNDVWQGIMAANEIGITPIKLNCVVMKKINDDEIADLASLSLKYPFHVRFIEYMPMGNSAVEMSQQMLIPEIKKRVELKLGKLLPVQRTKFDGPAKRYRLENGLGEIGFISPVSSHFCSQCNRLRLTSTGRLRPCLLHKEETDILGPLRSGASDNELKEIIKKVIFNKPLSHNLERHSSTRVNAQMSAIGG
ncbi:MAG: GTP 3',8-cyclase MoaA [Thermodesulfobacteriota bacterium]|nr:GTP 3',8-cyclase MoaA [Thermodesulfobacteriota bacterium]